MAMHSITKHYLFFVFLLLAGVFFTLTFGETPWIEVWEGVTNRFTGVSTEWNPLLDERIPRLIVILSAGSALAVSGAVMQSLFHNPLAAPSVLGITFGGSLMVTFVFIMGWQLSYPYAIPLAAFTGCMLTLLVVYGISRARGHIQLNTLILTGIAISTFLLAIQGAITYALRDHWHLIQTLTEWEAGSTVNRCWRHVHMQLPLTLVGLWGCWWYRYEIDILTMGEEEATNLGVDVAKVRWRLFLCVSLLTGGAIASVGVIGFFGLVLPHLLRRLYGPQNYRLIPLCTIGGCTALLLMDISLRIFNVQAFSIGNISAVLGGMFFVILLSGKQNQTPERETC